MDRFAIAVDETYHLGDGEGVAGPRVRVTHVVDIVIVFVAAAVATEVLLNYALCLQRLSSPARTWPALPVQSMLRRAQSSGGRPKANVCFFASARMVALGVA